MEQYVGTWASDAMYILIITSVLASQIAFHNAINRYTFTLARDGLLPARLAPPIRGSARRRRPGTAQSILAAVIVASFAIFGADPYADLLLKVNTPGVVGIILLQAITSAAVVSYFVRRRHTIQAALRHRVCCGRDRSARPGASSCWPGHIDLLTNADQMTNILLVGIVPLTLLIGWIAAGVLKVRNPAVYAGIGGMHAEDGHIPAAEPWMPVRPTPMPPSRWSHPMTPVSMSTTADLIVRADRIHTMDPGCPTAQAVAIRDGIIIGVGDRAGVATVAWRRRPGDRPRARQPSPLAWWTDTSIPVMGIGMTRASTSAPVRQHARTCRRTAGTARAAGRDWVLGWGLDPNVFGGERSATHH